MTREEELVRSTTRAIAASVREVPPLRLDPAGDERPARQATPRASRRLPYRWSVWAAPLTAAVVILALAIGLVSARHVLSSHPAASNPATAGPGGTPRYYAALTQVAGSVLKNNVQDGVLIGDSVTGTRVAVFKPPARTTFRSVTAAADDKTFVVFAVTSAKGKFPVPPYYLGATLTGSWYKVSLAPGTAHPATITRLPVPSWTWGGERPLRGFTFPTPGEVFASAVSASGRELAVASIPKDAGGGVSGAKNWQEIKVFSAASGRLLYDWTEHDTSAPFGYGLGSTPSVTWTDGDRAILFATSHQQAETVTATLRRLALSGPARANLNAHSTLVWSGALTWNDGYGCFAVDFWPPLISADGKTISCPNFEDPKGGSYQVNFDTDPIPGTGAGTRSRFDYRVTAPKNKADGAEANLYWVSANGSTLIVEWNFIGGHNPALTTRHFGVISHGKFTPVKVLPKLSPDGAFTW